MTSTPSRAAYVFFGGTTEPGGIHVHTADVARALGAAGHPVHILSSCVDYFSGPLRGMASRPGGEVPQVLQLALPSELAPLRRYNELKRVFSPFAGARLVVLRGSGGEGELVPLLAARGLFSRVFAIEHRVPDPRAAEPFLRCAQLAARRAVRPLVQRSIAVSVTVQRALVDELGYSPSRVTVCPNWVDVDHFRPDEDDRTNTRRVLGIGPDEVLVGCVGRLAPEKRIHVLLGAFAHLSTSTRLRLLVVGDGWKASELREDATRLGIGDRVIFSGWTSDPASYLRSLDLFVTAGELEGLPLSLLEALASGLPCLASPAIARACVDDGQEGFLRDLSSAEAVRAALLEVEGMDRRALRAMGERARARALRELGAMARLPAILEALEAPEAASLVRQSGVPLGRGPFQFETVPGGPYLVTPGTPAPLVTVVIPTYNRSSFVRRALASVQAQKYTRWEAVVVDDRSTDDTRHVVQAMAAEDARVRYLANTRERGPGGARNHGILRAEGEMVAFLDSDDLWDPDKLARQVALAAANPRVKLSATDYWILDEGTGERKLATDVLEEMVAYWLRTLPYRHLYDWYGLRVHRQRVVDARAVMAQAIGGFLWIQTSGVMADRSVLLGAGLFDESVRRTEDVRLWLRINARHGLGFVDAPLVTYHVDGRDGAQGPRYAAYDPSMRHSEVEELRAHLELCTFIRREFSLSLLEHGALTYRARLLQGHVARARARGAAGAIAHGEVAS